MEKLLKQFSVADEFGDRHSISIVFIVEEKYLLIRDSVRNSSNYQVLSIEYPLKKWSTRDFLRVFSLVLNPDAFKEAWRSNLNNGNVHWSLFLDKVALSLAGSVGGTVWQDFDSHDEDLLTCVELTEDGKAYLCLETYNPIATGALKKTNLISELPKAWIKSIIDEAK